MSLKDKIILKIARYELAEGSRMYSENNVKEAVLKLKNELLQADLESMSGDDINDLIYEIFGDFEE